MASLDEEVARLRAIVEEQSAGMRRLATRVEKLENAAIEGGKTKDVAVTSSAKGAPCLGTQRANRAVVSLEPQENEAQDLGAAAALVKEWRMLRNTEGDGHSKVERAMAEERRWELEIALIENFGLTLPPETTPLTASARETHLGWRLEALRRVERARVRAERIQLVRRVLTLGLWWR